VDPFFCGRGIGSELLKELSKLLLSRRGNGGLYVWAFEYNHRARKLYRRLGAVAVERAEAEAPGGGVVAEWRYAWPPVERLRDAITARHTKSTSMDRPCTTNGRSPGLTLRHGLRILGAIVLLPIALLRALAVRLDRTRLPDGAAKNRMLQAIHQAQHALTLRGALRVLHLSPPRYNQ